MQESSGKRTLGVALALDIVERTVLAAVFGWMAWSFLRSWQETGNIANLVLLASEGSVVLFILVRRFATAVSQRPAEWLIAVLGTTAPLLVQPSGGALASVVLTVPLMLAGISLQMAAKLTLRRSFGVVPANRGVKVGGPYRLVRHPMYAGYLMTQIGFLLTHPSVWNGAVYTVCFALQFYRILAEERVLSRDPAYRAFAAVVPYRLAPGLF